MYFDSHAHYDDKNFNEDREELLLNLKNHNVGYVVNIGVDMKSSYKSIQMAEKYDFVDVCKFVACICIVGIHTAAFSDLMGGGITTISSQGCLDLQCHFSL